jgi:hypothetical protein
LARAMASGAEGCWGRSPFAIVCGTRPQQFTL